ncbi:MAG: DUF2238 domain-containing protein [Verrucomicrobiae bacterium]|nr:DUF2238 domain-containing protein [Verrucomicrobiae bacterium]
MHRPATTTQIRLISGFTALYLAVSAISAWINGNGEFVFYILVMLIIIGAVAWVHHQVGFSAGLLCGLCGWGLLHMAGGLVPIPTSWHTGLDQGVLYNLWFIPQRLKYDQVVHAFGFGVTTWLCWQCLSVAFHSRSGTTLLPSLGLMVLCAAAGMGFGALNEVVEFFATLLLPSTNVGGYENTGWDLVANLVGSTAAALVIFFHGHSRS